MKDSNTDGPVLVLDQYDKSSWKNIPEWVRKAATEIGYTKKLWDKDKEPSTCEKDWKELNQSQKEAAKTLGYTSKLWNAEDDDHVSSSSSGEDNQSIHDVLVLDQYDKSSWKNLPDWVREAATEIGYTKKLWDKDKEPSTCEKDWEELTQSQKEAAIHLGYTSKLWNGEDDNHKDKSGSSKNKNKGSRIAEVNPSFEGIHKYEKWTIYCVQLYTETKDYKFQINDNIGISMYTNRAFAINERVTQSPVGPSNYEQLFQASPLPSSSSTMLSPERNAFAKRFLEWDHTYGAENRAGANNISLSLNFEDFFNPPTTSSDNRILPGPNNPVYDLNIFEHEILIVEFVAPPSNPNDGFLPERRFEVLPYDEGTIGSNREEGYSPERMNRPPTTCGTEGRSLEVPGHFSNHSCGSSSTAYDFLSDDMPMDMAPSVVLPSWIQDELNFKEKGDHLLRLSGDNLMTRRALSPGEEITTDYIRWHWTNLDTVNHSESGRTPIGYFFGTETWTQNYNDDDGNAGHRWEWDKMPPRIQWAGRILGYTKARWEDKSAKMPRAFGQKWKQLTAQEREAVVRFTGHTNETWDNQGDKNSDSSSSSSSSVISIKDLDWKDLSEEQRRAATFLGYTEQTWPNDEGVIYNDDVCFYELRPAIREAMAVLGETEYTYNEDEEDCDELEPWFLCHCAGPDCHSSKEKGGFRGLKFFPLEEQKNMVVVCEDFVKQQFQWKLYDLEQQRTNKQKPKKEL